MAPVRGQARGAELPPSARRGGAYLSVPSRRPGRRRDAGRRECDRLRKPLVRGGRAASAHGCRHGRGRHRGRPAGRRPPRDFRLRLRDYAAAPARRLRLYLGGRGVGPTRPHPLFAAFVQAARVRASEGEIVTASETETRAYQGLEDARNEAARLLDEGLYVVGFSFPVVPRGAARIRTQLSAGHSREQLDQVLDAANERLGRRRKPATSGRFRRRAAGAATIMTGSTRDTPGQHPPRTTRTTVPIRVRRCGST